MAKCVRCGLRNAEFCTPCLDDCISEQFEDEKQDALQDDLVRVAMALVERPTQDNFASLEAVLKNYGFPGAGRVCKHCGEVVRLVPPTTQADHRAIAAERENRLAGRGLTAG